MKVMFAAFIYKVSEQKNLEYARKFVVDGGMEIKGESKEAIVKNVFK